MVALNHLDCSTISDCPHSGKCGEQPMGRGGIRLFVLYFRSGTALQLIRIRIDDVPLAHGSAFSACRSWGVRHDSSHVVEMDESVGHSPDHHTVRTLPQIRVVVYFEP